MSKKSIPAEIRGTVPVWFTSDLYGPQHLMSDPIEAINAVSFYDPGMHHETGQTRIPTGWTLVGHADIVIRTVDEQQMVENKVESLRAKKNEVLAAAQAQATEIEGQIQRLLAISYDAPEVAA